MIKIYAKCVAERFSVIHQIINGPRTAVTIDKEYEVLPLAEECELFDFDIIDDEGDRVQCSWTHDPDVVWERVERPMSTSYVVTGRPLSAELRQVFEPYVGEIKGLVVLPEGVKVDTESGDSVLFVPVFVGGVL